MSSDIATLSSGQCFDITKVLRIQQDIFFSHRHTVFNKNTQRFGYWLVWFCETKCDDGKRPRDCEL